jgi:hypothetical protein
VIDSKNQSYGDILLTMAKKIGRPLTWGFLSLLGFGTVVATQVGWAETSAVQPADRGQRVSATSSVSIVAPAPKRQQQPPPKRTRLLSSNSFDLFVDALIQVESGGNPLCTGAAGERGLMQIKRTTWNETVAWLYSKSISFDRAFSPTANREVGTGYLVYLTGFLNQHAEKWHRDHRLALLAACYNAGPGAVRRAGFRLDRLPLSTQRYVERIIALHGQLMVEMAGEFALVPSG